MLASLTALSLLAVADAPYPAALNDAAIRVDRLDDILESALVLGNGDLNGLLFSDGGQLVLRLTKNDVWDARLACENDPPLPTLELIRRRAADGTIGRGWILPDGWTWPLGHATDSYQSQPYPCPIACGTVRLGPGAPAPRWRRIRSLGSSTDLAARDGALVMSLAGQPGASNGYAYGPLSSSTDQHSRLTVTVSGSANARYFVEVMDSAGERIAATMWQDSPAEPTTVSHELPPGRTIRHVYAYTWTEDGQPAENRFATIALDGPAGTLACDLSLTTAPTSSAVLDVARATAEVAGGPDFAPATVRCLHGSNAFVIESPHGLELTPPTAKDLPPAERGETDGARWLEQTIPGDADWPGMRFVVAVAGAPGRWAVSIATSLDAPDPLAAAVRLAHGALAADADSHEAAWREFWSVSGVQLADVELQRAWYRNLYFLRCVSRPGVQCVGLFAGLVDDTPAWHGDYHTNYNIQQTFWGAYNSGHAALAEPYDRLMLDYLPRAQWVAKQVYGLEGAFYPHVLFAYEPPDPAACRSTNGRQYVHHDWGLTLGVPAFCVQPLWWHYLYDPSPELLARIYPALRETSEFYRRFIEQCERRDGFVRLGPTVSPEHWGWTPNFERNFDCAFDIALIRYLLRATARAAGELGRDENLQAGWRAADALLPPYPTSGGEAPVIVDVAGAPPIEYNIAIPATPVFPGDLITFASPEAERALLARSIEQCRWNGNNSAIILGVARARLGVGEPAAWLRGELLARTRPNGTLTLNRLGHPFNAFGHYTEQFAATAAVGELLVQSVGDVLRVFPALPAESDAAFRGLRAQGGFEVAAERRAGRVTTLEIRSRRGGPLRLQSPWPTLRVRRAERLETLTPGPDGVASLATSAGETLRFEP